MNLWVFWSLVWGRNTRELYHQASTGHRIKPLKRTLDFSCTGFLVQPLWIPLLDDMERRINKHLNKRK